MPFLQKIAGGLRAVFRKHQVEQDMDDELRAYVEAAAAEKRATGLSREASARAARLEAGSLERLKEDVRATGWESTVESFWQDLRFGLRMLRKNPGFSAVAILTLALGIGANTAIFSVAYGVLLRPLPFPQPDRIVQLAANLGQQCAGCSPAGELDLTWSQLQRLRQHTEPFEHVAGYTDADYNLEIADVQAEHVRGNPVSAEYFQVLGVRPALGRDFLPEEDAGGGQPAVILSHELWMRQFDGDSKTIGHAIQLNGDPYTVIGIMPASFDPLGEAAGLPGNSGLAVDLWIPLATVAKTAGSGENIPVIARLRAGVTPAQLQAQMDIASGDLHSQFPRSIGPNLVLSFIPYRQMIGFELRPTFLLLLGAIGFVLLIACANVANLLLARGASRGREIAVRIALGASRRRLFRQLLTESVLIALAGGVLGLFLAALGLKSLLALAPVGVPRLNDIRLDDVALGFTFLISLVTGLLFGIAPSWYATKANLSGMLNDGGSHVSAGTGQTWLRRGLVVGECALSLVLLTGAGLMIASLTKLIKTNPGFDTHQILTMQYWLVGSKYDSTAEIGTFTQQVEERLKTLPGVVAVGAVAAGLPLERGGNNGVQLPGAKEREYVGADYREITPGYFSALGIPLTLGRTFADSDSEVSDPVVIINQVFARRYLSDRNPLGERLKVAGQVREVIGVVGDVKSYLDQPAEPTTFIPAGQAEFGTSKLFEGWFPRNIVIQTTGDPMQLNRAMRQAVAEVDPLVPTGTIQSMDQVLMHSLAVRSFMMVLLSLFGCLALALASVGIYGVVSYAVVQQTREIGIRMALGARTANVLSLVIKEGMTLVGVGIALGSVCAFATTPLLASQLYGVKPADPIVFLAVAVVLGIVALLACYIPARRASRVDPIIALRSE